MKIVEFTQRRGIFAPMRSWDDSTSTPAHFAGAAISGSRASPSSTRALAPIGSLPWTHPTGEVVQLTLSEVLSFTGRKLFTFLGGTQFAADMDDAIERLEPAISRAHADLARHLDRKVHGRPRTRQGLHGDGDLIYEPPRSLIYDNLSCGVHQGLRVKSSYVPEPDLMTYRQGLYPPSERPSKTDRVPTPRTSAASAAPSARSA